jgi:hypothetical protein
LVSRYPVSAGPETDAAIAALHRDRRLFDEGLVIIERNAHFTPTGKVVFDHACRFVETLEIRAGKAAPV